MNGTQWDTVVWESLCQLLEVSAPLKDQRYPNLLTPSPMIHTCSVTAGLAGEQTIIERGGGSFLWLLPKSSETI